MMNMNLVSRQVRTFRQVIVGIVSSMLLLLSLPIGSMAQVAVIDSSLHTYVDEAIQNNPDLGAWRSRVEAADQRIPQAGAWMDPMLSLSMMNLPTNSFALDQEPMTGTWINVSQEIPLTHMFAAREEIAGWMKEKEQFQFENRQLTIADQVVQGWYDWAYLRSAVATVDTTINLLDGLIDVSLTRYESGKGLQQDVLRLQTERTRFEDNRAMLEQMAETSGRKFAVLLGRSPDDIPTPPGDLTYAFPAIDDSALDSALLMNNPALAGMKRGQRIAAEKIEQAKRSLWPNLKLTAGYGFRQTAPNGVDRPDFVSVGAGFSIPLYAKSKQLPAIREAHAAKVQSDEQVRDTQLKLQLALASLQDQDRRLDKQITLYRHGVLPEAEATLEASMSAWSTGKIDVDGLLNTEIALTKARLELLARVRDRVKTRSSMDALLGGTDLLNKPAGAAKEQGTLR